MKKQTAVEWLKEQLEEYGSSSHLSLDWSTFDELVEQAKVMQREQIKEAYIYGFGERDEIDKNLFFNPLAVEYNEKKFYNYLSETYKSYEQ